MSPHLFIEIHQFKINDTLMTSQGSDRETLIFKWDSSNKITRFCELKKAWFSSTLEIFVSASWILSVGRVFTQLAVFIKWQSLWSSLPRSELINDRCPLFYRWKFSRGLCTWRNNIDYQVLMTSLFSRHDVSHVFPDHTQQHTKTLTQC